MNNLKDMLVLKDLPSNLIEKAYVVLNPTLKLKIQEIEKNKVLEEKNKILEKDYIIKEAKFVLLNYISEFEKKVEKINSKILEKKYKKLKKITIFTFLTFFVYVLGTLIF